MTGEHRFIPERPFSERRDSGDWIVSSLRWSIDSDEDANIFGFNHQVKELFGNLQPRTSRSSSYDLDNIQPRSLTGNATHPVSIPSHQTQETPTPRSDDSSANSADSNTLSMTPKEQKAQPAKFTTRRPGALQTDRQEQMREKRSESLFTPHPTASFSDTPKIASKHPADLSFRPRSPSKLFHGAHAASTPNLVIERTPVANRKATTPTKDHEKLSTQPTSTAAPPLSPRTFVWATSIANWFSTSQTSFIPAFSLDAMSPSRTNTQNNYVKSENTIPRSDSDPSGSLSSLQEKEWDTLESCWTGESTANECLRSLMLKGFPVDCRAEAWIKITNCQGLMTKNPGVFERLSDAPSPVETRIHNDVSRTFPEHPMFQDTADGRKHLSKMLKAYSVFDPSIGYCQGMNFIAAVILTVMSPEESFWAFVQIMRSCHVALFFRSDSKFLRTMMAKFDFLLQKQSPKLTAHFKKFSIDPSVFVNHWFITLFSYDFPMEVVLRIWDVVIIERDLHFLIKIALALMKICENDVVGLCFEEILCYYKKLPQKLPPVSEIIQLAMRVPVDLKRMRKIESDVEKSIAAESASA